MVDVLSATGVQLRSYAPCDGPGRLLADEAACGERGREPRAGLSDDRDAAQRATGFVCAFFATVMGFALIWHIWWMVILRLRRRLATFVVFAWRDRAEYGSRPRRWRASTGTICARGVALPAAGGVMSIAARAPADRSRRRTGRERRPRSAAGRVEAHHRRLRLLDLPAQRHRDVLGFFAAYAVLSGAAAGGPADMNCST